MVKSREEVEDKQGEQEKEQEQEQEQQKSPEISSNLAKEDPLHLVNKTIICPTYLLSFQIQIPFESLTFLCRRGLIPIILMRMRNLKQANWGA